MKRLNLNDEHINSLSIDEMKSIDGGGLVVWAFMAGMALAYYEARIKDS